MSEGRDPYELLGVQRGASLRQIRDAYLKRARRAHPDLVGTRGLDLMTILNEAWAILKDADRRAAYDAANGGPATSASPGGVTMNEDDPNRPFWTGASGPPPGRPLGPVLDFGIFAGWSLGEISRRDPGYLRWLRDRPEAEPYRAQIDKLMDPDADEPVDTRRGRRR